MYERNKSYKIMSPERAVIQMMKEKTEFLSIPKNVNKEKLLTLAKQNTSKNIYKKIQKLCL